MRGHLFRKVTRKIYDFSPEQLADLTAIVWLHRGETKRFTALLDDYREKCRAHGQALLAALPEAQAATNALCRALEMGSARAPRAVSGASPETSSLLGEAGDLMGAARAGNESSAARPPADLHESPPPPRRAPKTAREARALLDADTCRALLHRLREVRRVVEPLTTAALDNGASKEAKKELKMLRQRADEAWTRATVEAEAVIYFTRHLDWLLHRFPEGRYRDVPGLCRAVTRAEIAAADWSLTPGRYVGVATAEVDEDFDFEQTMQDIHAELKELNAEAVALAGKIETNFEELLA